VCVVRVTCVSVSTLLLLHSFSTTRLSTDKREYENEVSWSTSTWLALQAQRLSVAVHIASAWEIATEMQLAGGGGEAPSSDEEPGRRHGVSPHRTLSGHVACLFVFVCVCVCVLSSRCLVCRPSHLCVCRVAPPPMAP
jgi:hypothetical protein